MENKKNIIALSFVGNGNYSDAKYRLNTKIVTSKFIQIAVQKFYPEIDKHYLFLTDDARKKHGQELQQLGFDEKFMISVPKGETEVEQWEIAQAIQAVIEPHSELIIDVTHGFRIQPMLLLSISNFIQTIGRARIKSVLYGTFDLNNPNIIHPVFELTSFVKLGEWSLKVNQFLQNGRAAALEALFVEIKTKAFFSSESKPKSTNFMKLGKALAEVSEVLLLIRPKEIEDRLLRVSDLLTQVDEEIEGLPELAPLLYLKDVIKKELDPLLSTNKKLSYAGLLHYYNKKGMYQQALTLAVEIIITKICERKSLNPYSKEDRDLVSTTLYNISNKTVQASDEETQLAMLLSKLQEYRNDVNHAGFRKEPKPANKVIKQIHTSLDELIPLINDVT